MNLLDWIKKEFLLWVKIGITNLKLNLLIVPAAIILQVALYLHFKDSLSENGIWVLAVPMWFAIVVAIIYLLPKRNNPNYQIYYLFHLSKISKLILLAGTIFLAALFFFAQCREYNLSVGSSCFKAIFGI